MQAVTTHHESKHKIENARIGIALGSGSARGWAHIGVLKALADLGIEPAFVAGSSIGALVGAAYASNKLDEMENMVKQLSWKELVAYLDMSVTGGGLIQGEKLVRFLRQQIKEKNIESLPRHFAAVATELNTGREIWIQKGDLIEAVRASAALPGLFTPYKKDGTWLIDGGIVDPVPVSLCRAMGADIVIAVSLNGDIVNKHSKKNNQQTSAPATKKTTDDSLSELWNRISGQLGNSISEKKDILLSRLFGESLNSPGLIEVLAGSINIMQDRITRSRMAGDPPDILITPRLAQLGLLEFDQGKIAIEEGHESVRYAHSELERLIL